MRRISWCLAVAACGADAPPPVAGEPERAADVIVDVPRGIGTVVYQDGDGGWRLATEVAPRRYGFDVGDDEGRYGVAIACADEHVQELAAVFASVDEQRDVVLAPACGSPPRQPEHAIYGAIRMPDGAFRVSTGARQTLENAGGPDAGYAIAAHGGLQTALFQLMPSNSETRFALHRDLLVDGDLALDVDYDTAAPAATFGLLGSAQLVEVLFVTGDGAILPITPLFTQVAYPPRELWRAGDHLIVAMGRFDQYLETLTIETYDAGLPPTDLFVERVDGFGGFITVLPGSRHVAAVWNTTYPGATHYAVRMSPGAPIEHAGCTGGCFPRWSARISPGRLEDVASIIPPEARLRQLGAWDDRLALDLVDGPIVYNQSAVVESRDEATRARRTIEASILGTLGGGIEK